jgi:hypothetical protein
MVEKRAEIIYNKEGHYRLNLTLGGRNYEIKC